MSEYATYKLWNGRKAPNNLEFNGRLIGEKGNINNADNTSNKRLWQVLLSEVRVCIQI